MTPEEVVNDELARFADADTNPATAYELGRHDGEFVARERVRVSVKALENVHEKLEEQGAKLRIAVEAL